MQMQFKTGFIPTQDNKLNEIVRIETLSLLDLNQIRNELCEFKGESY